jgi:hypothetical protein
LVCQGDFAGLGADNFAGFPYPQFQD